VKKNILLLLFFLFPIANTTFAYSVDTHEILSEKATEHSKLASDKGDYLKNLGFKNNIDEVFSGKEVIKLIKVGSVDEDKPFLSFRYRNHFHNPLPIKIWEEAGLDDFFTGKSSLVWAQDSENEFSWQNVRQYYYDALTTGSEESFAKTFKGLGHIIHLIQDAAQPAHVRNDFHMLDPFGLKPRLSPGLETWSKNKPGIISAFASQPVFPTVNLSVPINGYEPITQFFDTAQGIYDGTNPSTSLSQGLAEYANANFASDDTIFTENYDSNHKHYFPFPRKEDTIEYNEYVGDGKYRTYFKKIQNGETINHLAAIERLHIYLDPWPRVQLPFHHLDEQCHEDYTEKLIPRAVGYSTGLIDYFFRGEIEVDQINAESITITNNSSETMVGIFTLYYDATNGNRKPVENGQPNNEWPLSLQAGQTSNELTFTEPTDIAEGTQYILVFKGSLGSETGAVVGKVVVEKCPLFTASLLTGPAPLSLRVYPNAQDRPELDNFLYDFNDGSFSYSDTGYYLGSSVHVYVNAGAYTPVVHYSDEPIWEELPDVLLNKRTYRRQTPYYQTSEAEAWAAYSALSWVPFGTDLIASHYLQLSGTSYYRYSSYMYIVDIDLTAYDDSMPIYLVFAFGSSPSSSKLSGGVQTSIGGNINRNDSTAQVLSGRTSETPYYRLLDLTSYAGTIITDLEVTDNTGYARKTDGPWAGNTINGWLNVPVRRRYVHRIVPSKCTTTRENYITVIE
jgi:hypothetical protein